MDFLAKSQVVIQSLNVLGCCVSIWIYCNLWRLTRWPLTLDILITILLAEYNRYSNERRRRLAVDRKKDVSLASLECGSTSPGKAIAAIVGYREDPTLFSNALQSYIGAEACGFILACIDGNDTEDREMVSVFEQTYEKGAAVLNLTKPLVDVAQEYAAGAAAVSSNVDDEQILEHCRQVARDALMQNQLQLRGAKALTRLCVTQPHMHKKGIIFTAFIFASVIAETINAEFIWSSDSDSWLLAKSDIAEVISTMVHEPKIGGASTALCIHNRDDSVIAKIVDAVYQGEWYMVRSFAAAFGTNDCQSGPCAMFRVKAVMPILMKWYRQSFLGHWMVTNEDRHLTSCLLLEGWKVTFISDVHVATETPHTLRRYVLQQARWARAIFIESVAQPRVYVVQSPVLFFNALRRIPTTFLAPLIAITYLFTGRVFMSSIPTSWADIVLRFALRFIYLLLRHPLSGPWHRWLWAIPGQIFFSVTTPAFALWGAFTCLNDSWGTSMRSSASWKRSVTLLSKIWDTGFFVVWMAVLAGGWMRLLPMPESLGVDVDVSVRVWVGFTAAVFIGAACLYREK